MRALRLMTATLLAFCAINLHAQVMLSTWLRNTTGKVGTYWASSGGMNPAYTWTVTTDSADVLTVAYNNNYVYIRSNGMTDSMGKYLNPGNCVAQGYKHMFPRAQTIPGTKTTSPLVGQIGLLLNGIPIYGLSNANSWNGSSNVPMGSGVWNVEVGKSEGFVLDATLGAHPQQQGAYHSHDKPYRLYKNTPTNQHSPIVGWSFDGFPVYGPYGYSSPMDAASAITRMKSGYSLRNITTRTILPSGAAASQTGPPVSGTYPIGTYVEDYEWLASNGGDLDAYNGRYCVTPEFPGGTYAYFVTVDAAGAAQFPYYIGIQYYGAPATANFPMGPGGNSVVIPGGVLTYTGGTLAVKIVRFEGKQTPDDNTLYWTLTNAERNSRIYLERSANGETFNELSSFVVSQAADYSYRDAHPLQNNYYRLKIVGPSGLVTYSNIISLSNKTKSSAVVYPTLTTGLVNVESLSQGATISVCDGFGRKVITKTPAEAQTTLNLSSFARGMYLVTVTYNDVKEVFKVVKE